VAAEALAILARTIADRRESAPEGSYTATLLGDPELAGRKVEEEAEEVVRAARDESGERVAEEAADVLYHLAVLLAGRGVELADVYEVLNARRR
jgi:phosphoribosyl-ATP pyrophosphohydrolase/phosphoribosyl-AMP cyclohydrolase